MRVVLLFCLVLLAAAALGTSVVIGVEPPVSPVAEAGESFTVFEAHGEDEHGASAVGATGGSTRTRRAVRRRVTHPRTARRRIVADGILTTSHPTESFVYELNGERVQPPLRVRSGVHTLTISRATRDADHDSTESRDLEVRVPPHGSVVVDVSDLIVNGHRCARDETADWLSRHQGVEGAWSSSEFGRLCGGRACGDTVSGVDDAETTALAILTYLGAGETHNAGEYKRIVKNGLRFLKTRQSEEGWFAEASTDVRTHAIATLTMVEAYGLTGSRLFKDPARRAVEALIATQLAGGGFRASLWERSPDIEATTWAAFVLRSAQLSELEPPDDAVERAQTALHDFGAPAGHALRECAMLSAARVVLREDPNVEGELQQGVRHLVASARDELHDLDPRTAYFGTLAAFQTGGDTWKTWKGHMQLIVDAGVPGDDTPKHRVGAYAVDSAATRELGAIRTTSYLHLVLEVYYRYGRVFGASSR